MPRQLPANVDASATSFAPDHIPPTPSQESEGLNHANNAVNTSDGVDVGAGIIDPDVFILSSDEESDSSHSPSSKTLSNTRSSALTAAAALPQPAPSGHTPHSALSEFLLIALSTILSARGVYPSSCFSPAHYAGVPAPAPRHPLLASYLTSLSTLMDEGILVQGHSRILVPVFPPSVVLPTSDSTNLSPCQSLDRANACAKASSTSDCGEGNYNLPAQRSGLASVQPDPATAPELATLPSGAALAPPGRGLAQSEHALALPSVPSAPGGAETGSEGCGVLIEYPIMRPIERYIFDILIDPPVGTATDAVPPLLSLAALSSLQLLCGAAITRLDAAARWALPRWAQTRSSASATSRGAVQTGADEAAVPEGSWFRVLLCENGDGDDDDGHGTGDGSALLGVAAGATGEALLSAHHHKRWVPAAAALAAAIPADASGGDRGRGGAQVVAVHDFSWRCSRSGSNTCSVDGDDAWTVHVMVFAEFAQSSAGLDQQYT